MKEYLLSIAATEATGKATEHSYRAAVEALFKRRYPELAVTNEPRRQACGAPDFLVQRDGVAIGYIEAKDLPENIDDSRHQEQFGRYRRSLDNLLITDYLHWQLWQRGEKVMEVRIGDYTKGQPVKARPQDYAAFAEMLQVFTAAKGQRISSAETLAQLMADKARLLQYVLLQALTHPEVTVSPSGLTTATAGSLESQYEAFKQMLIHDLTEAQFADIYAQTIAYGLFAARLHDATPDTFSRQEALTLVPASNPFLRKLFSYVAGTDLDERVVWIVDALAELFRAADVAALLQGFGQSTQMTDPFLYFYETFLGRYNPALKKSRGVYYTPQPVVRFIVRAVDEVLRRDFGLAEGLADTAKTTVDILVPEIKYGKATGKSVKAKKEVARVQVLDPATGTGTFLAEVVRHIHASLGGGAGFWNQYVEQHLIPRLHGFEIMMASYAMCHLKLGLLLGQLGYKSQQPTPPRLSVYLTNALEESHPDTHTLFASWLSDESNLANTIKRDAPVMVVLGNPPYSSSSTNKGEWILNLIQDYKRGLNERKINLDDDYIKFIRYAEHFIEKNGQGVIGFITNNSFLDGLTHRNMRKHLLETFDYIYIYNLHGDVKRKDTAPDGSKDENVFDIQQGVSIFILSKSPAGSKDLATVKHLDSYGKRTVKYEELEKISLSKTAWNTLNPIEPNYFFTPNDNEFTQDYSGFIGLGEIFNANSSGIQTKRDGTTIRESKDALKLVIDDFASLGTEEVREKYQLPADGRDWKIEWAAQHCKNTSIDFNPTRVLYRPFDHRWTILDNQSKGLVAYPRYETMRHFNNENLGLITTRQLSMPSFQHIMVTETAIDGNAISLQTREYNTVFPLYLYPDSADLYAPAQRRPNLKLEAVARLATATGLRFVPETEATPDTFAPEDVLDYVYGILHQPAYRRRYHELLRIDFPRVPLPASAGEFRAVVAFGHQLRELHLLRPAALPAPLPTRFGGDGPTLVEKPRYDAATQRVYLNASLYVEPVAPDVWALPIGGYQPAQKWLKDRQGRTLTFEEGRHYQRLLAALQGTERLMREWDAAHPAPDA
ncbi:N-6 DNA methylase [Hymenobacter sp. 5317J-9]|uniref:type ISP restriction/modification enzyme n=1 Tax=Hymenobacter sp. 5317J-9 TaxID=2932250 RepID=UPI001FD70E2A|nr:type ISP restriction/modification enzyme [Hymenobacter sp. 5317J-9]UOQ95933.1 N-6 DNA methylase [Hymenobacter sp. 5317J-9]